MYIKQVANDKSMNSLGLPTISLKLATLNFISVKGFSESNKVESRKFKACQTSYSESALEKRSLNHCRTAV